MYQSLQGCRAIAAALVVLFHLGGTFAQDRYFGFKALDGPFAWGDSGVDFFFVLSGFLITFAHRRDFGRPKALRAYVLKRTLRIYPTYWLICGAVCVAAIAVPALRQALPGDALTYLEALTLIPLDPAVVGGTGSPILFVAWSLQYEMLFYAIIAVVILNRVAGVLVALALLLVLAGCQLGTTCGFPQSFVANPMILLFCLGVGTAYLVGSPAFRLPMPLFIVAASAVAFVAFGLHEVAVGRDAAVLDRRLVYGVLSSLIILGLVQAEDDRSLVLKHPLLALLGDASYSLYLMHIPIISVLSKVGVQLHLQSRPAQAAFFVFAFLVCVGSSVLFYRGVERPILRWLRRKTGSAAKPVSVVTPEPLPAAPLVRAGHEGLR